jgi:modulator of FtsH protease
MSTHSSDHASAPFPPARLAPPALVAGDESRAVFGQTMGLVALALGFLALGAYVGRDLSGGWGIAFFIAGFACLVALNVATGRDRQQIATALLLGLGLCLGLGLGPAINDYAQADPAAVWQAAGATAGFVLVAGAVGYGTRRDLSSWARALTLALVALLIFGVVAIFVSIPQANVI